MSEKSQVRMIIEPVAPGDRFIRVSVHGPYKVADLKAVADHVLEAASGGSLRRVLMDLSGLDAPPSAIAAYVMASYLAEQWGMRIKAAFFGRTQREFQFPETVAVNRGANLAGFEHREEAERWLLA